MAATARENYGPRGDESRHLSLAPLEAGLAQLPEPPKDEGWVHLIMTRHANGKREVLREIVLTPEGGVPGDRWERHLTDHPEMQITAMRHDVASLIANEQAMQLFGDNLFVDLDLSAETLPVGTRLQVGDAQVVVSPMPHDGCAKFKARFGADALHLVSGKAMRHLNLRGIYWTAVQPGRVAAGSPIQVLSRP